MAQPEGPARGGVEGDEVCGGTGEGGGERGGVERAEREDVVGAREGREACVRWGRGRGGEGEGAPAEEGEVGGEACARPKGLAGDGAGLRRG